MSKKTKQEKHKRTLKAQARRRRVHVPRKNIRRPNPLKIKRDARPKSELLFADPIFLYHVASCILRAIELTDPKLYTASMEMPQHFDAEFIKDLIKPKEPIQ